LVVQETKMRSITMIACLGLLLCIEPVAAQTMRHPVTVSVHRQVDMNKFDVMFALRRASRLLQRTNSCRVGLKLSGRIKHFDGPLDITNETELEKVHNVDADIKVVSTITFCKTGGSYFGCAWRPPGLTKTVIIAQDKPGAFAIQHVVWAHEFGHTKGLPHRADNRRALMWPCGLDTRTTRINPDECDCFRDGCTPPTTDPHFTCADNN
jgi:hypothetical protein